MLAPSAPTRPGAALNLKGDAVMRSKASGMVMGVILAATLPHAATSADRTTRRSAVVMAVEKAAPAVANISTEQVVLQRHYDPFWGSRDRFFGDLFEDFFGRYRKAKVATPLGSGVLIDADGYIVTNEHVISRAATLKVHLQGEKVYEARLISSDPEQDLAVIKIEDDKPLPYIRMGTSKGLMPGETVIAIGNPFGYESSVTTGVLSAIRREVKVPTSKGYLVYRDLIQTDALINPGNSGGPLINIDGELIGINTAIRADAQGIGFAIPIDTVKDVLVKLFDFEKIRKLWFGVKVEPRPGRAAGIVVTGVDPRSPAQEAGLRQGDVILQVDSAPVRSLFDFEKYLFKRTVGATVRVAIDRDGRRLNLPVTLVSVPKPSGKALAQNKLGLSVQGLTPALARRLRLPVEEGALVLDVSRGGPAHAAQIEVGDVIVRLGRYVVRDLDELGILLDAAQRGDVVSALFVRGGRTVWHTRIKVR